MPYKDPEQAKVYRKKYYAAHKEEAKLYAQNDRATNPDKYRAWELMKKYGLTLEQLSDMKVAQQFRCAWCGIHEDELGSGDKGLLVDHCHSTGTIRRLMCPNCNRSEGMLKHSPQIITAIEAVAWYNINRGCK